MRWRRRALILCGLIASGCAVGVPRPPLALISPRPAHILDQDGQITDAGVHWVQELANKYIENCVALSSLRRENPKQCRVPFELPP